MNKMAALFILLVLLLSACSLPPQETPAPTELPTLAPTPISGGGYPEAVFIASDLLAQNLGITSEQVQVVNVEAVDWPDACLGVPTDEMCAQVITPGYRITLGVGLTQYELHTDAVGSVIRQMPEPVVGTPGEEVIPALTWQNNECDRLSVTSQTAFFSTCQNETLMAAPIITPEQLQVVFDWVQSYASFEAATPAGTVSLNGFGELQATPAEQRMMAEWAKLTFDVAQSGRTGAAWGLALTWQRQGGIAGFCDDVYVHLDGQVYVSNCKQGETPLPPFRLNASQLEQLYGWVDTLRTLEVEESNPGVSDNMTLRLNLYGTGRKKANDETVQAINEFASWLAAQSLFNLQAGNQRFAAEDVLRQFYTVLNHGEYAAAAQLYGGVTDVLQTWNPDLADNLPAMLENACKRNGLQCLSTRSVTYRGPDERGGYQFIVEFMNPDGSLFRQGPCCGDDTASSVSYFIISVIDQGGSWKVMDLPPYVP